jgi:hypothetical protein
MKLQKLIALLLALVMVLALAACGNDDAKKDDGKDPTTSTTAPTDPPADPTDPPADPTDPPADPTDPTDPPNAPSKMFDKLPGSWAATLSFNGEAMGVPAFTGTLDMKVITKFDADGTYTMTVDTEAFAACVEDNKDALIAGMLQLIYDTYGSEAEAEASIQASAGMSCTEYAAAYVESLKDELAMDEEQGSWTAEGSTLYLDGDPIGSNIRDDVMEWWGPAIEEAFAVEELTFNRIAE